MTNLMDRRKVLGAASLAAGTCLLGSGEAEAEPARGNLTVHVLDLYSGSPAKGVKVDLFMRRGEHLTSLKSVATDTDGRSGTLLEGDAFAAGRYLLMFDLSDYFKGANKTPSRQISTANCRWSSRSPTRPYRSTYRSNARRGRRHARCCRADRGVDILLPSRDSPGSVARPFLARS
jgi:5-hydroxyisourate hydrolase-like protein (transthyretin family)